MKGPGRPPMNPLLRDRTRLTSLRRKARREVKAFFKQYYTISVMETLKGFRSSMELLATYSIMTNQLLPSDLSSDEPKTPSENESKIPKLTFPEQWVSQLVGKVYTVGLGRSYDLSQGVSLDFAQYFAKQTFIRTVLYQTSSQSQQLVINAKPKANVKTSTPRIPPRRKKGKQRRDVKGRFLSNRQHLLAQRLTNELQSVTLGIAQRLSRELIKAQEQNLSSRQVLKNLKGQLDLEEARAQKIVTTEMTRIYAEAQLDAMESLGEEEVTGLVEWTTGSGNPCPKCQSLEGETYTIDEARGLIPLHPYCYCSWTVVR